MSMNIITKANLNKETVKKEVSHNHDVFSPGAAEGAAEHLQAAAAAARPQRARSPPRRAWSPLTASSLTAGPPRHLLPLLRLDLALRDPERPDPARPAAAAVAARAAVGTGQTPCRAGDSACLALGGRRHTRRR